MSNPSATRAAGELARLRRCISAIERRADAPPARPPVPWSAGEEEDWSAHDWNQENRSRENWSRENENQESWGEESWSRKGSRENRTGSDGDRSDGTAGHGDGDEGGRGTGSRDDAGRNGGPRREAGGKGERACAPGGSFPARPIPDASAGPARAPSAASQTQMSGGGPAHDDRTAGAQEPADPVWESVRATCRTARVGAQEQAYEQEEAQEHEQEREHAQEHAPLDDPDAALSQPHPLLPHPPLPLGLPHLDGVLGGGLALGALHEAAARGPGAEGALTGFALALAARAAFQLKRPVLMVQHELAELEAGSLYAPGLAELGLCGGALVLVRVRKAQDVLFAMEEGLKCGGLSAVLGEVGTAFPEALTATRRLSLAARAHPVLGLLLRQRPDAAACAALTRWVIAPAASTPRDSHGGLGQPTLEAALMRNRLGPLGRWTLCLAGPAFLSAEAPPAFPRPAREAGS